MGVDRAMELEMRKAGIRRMLPALGLGLTWVLAAGLAAAADEPEGWNGELAVSVTAQSGTTDTFAGSLDAKAERDWEKDAVGVRFNAVYGTSKKRQSSDGSRSETIQNAQGLYGDWKHTVHERFFWNSGAQISRDNTQGRELRAALSTGPGIRAWQGESPAKNHLDIDLGVGYRYEIYDGNTGAGVAKNGDTDHFADVVAGFEYKNLFFDDRVEYTHTGSAKMPVNDVESYILVTEAIVGIPLSKAWSFRTSFYVEYVANPGVADVNKTTTRTTVGLGYEF